MKDENDYAAKKFKEAFLRLKNGIHKAKDELDKDGVIQRFEFTFELLWKSLKIYLEDKGIICRSPKDCLKEAFKYGLIKNENIFIEMLNDRNKMSHIYSKEDSEEIFLRIKNKYVMEIEKLIEVL